MFFHQFHCKFNASIYISIHIVFLIKFNEKQSSLFTFLFFVYVITFSIAQFTRNYSIQLKGERQAATENDKRHFSPVNLVRVFFSSGSHCTVAPKCNKRLFTFERYSRFLSVQSQLAWFNILIVSSKQQNWNLR